jgi:hypothetical protein
MGIFSITYIVDDGKSYIQINIFFIICGNFSELNILNDRNNILIFKAIKFCRGVSSKNMYNININIYGREDANKIKAYGLEL